MDENLAETVPQAYEVLRTADTFADAHVGIAAVTPRTVLALRTILKDPAAPRLFGQLLEEAALPGQLYALAGLCLVAPEQARTAAAPYLASDAQVDTLFGCLGGPQAVSGLAEQIMDGGLPRWLAGT